MSLSYSAPPSPSHSSPSEPSSSAAAAAPSDVAAGHVHLPALHGIHLSSSSSLSALSLPTSEAASAAPLVRAPSDGLLAKMVAGGLSCMLISSLLNPMDVVKIRLQTQNQLNAGPATVGHSHSLLPAASLAQQQAAVHSSHRASPLHLSMYADSKYKGMTDGLLTIYREESYGRGLMRGVTPSLLREASYSSVRMGLYDYFRGVVAPAGTRKEEFTLFHKLLAGVCSGALGSSLFTPLDLLKIRFQSYSAANPNPYRHTLHAFSDTVRTSGLSGLYKGVGPTTLRAAVLNSACLASYDHSKAWLIRSGRASDGPLTHLFASLVSGLVTTTVVNPFDVVKTRIMTDGTNAAEKGNRRYRSALHCAMQTWQSEGSRAFSKGWLPNYLRLGPHFVLSLPLGEFIRVQLGADTY